MDDSHSIETQVTAGNVAPKNAISRSVALKGPNILAHGIAMGGLVENDDGYSIKCMP